MLMKRKGNSMESERNLIKNDGFNSLDCTNATEGKEQSATTKKIGALLLEREQRNRAFINQYAHRRKIKRIITKSLQIIAILLSVIFLAIGIDRVTHKSIQEPEMELVYTFEDGYVALKLVEKTNTTLNIPTK